MFSFMNIPDQEIYKNECSSIVPGILYLSGYIPANDINVLNDYCITHVIQIGDSDDFPHYIRHEGLIYMTIDIEDSVKCHFTRELLDSAIQFIREANAPVLVHCRAGVSRSATVAMAYMIAVQGLTYREAKAAVIRGRPCVSPNRTFLKDLLIFSERKN